VDITRAGLAEITAEKRLQRLVEMMGPPPPVEVDAVICKLQQMPHGDLPFGHLAGAKWVREQLEQVVMAFDRAGIAIPPQEEDQQQQQAVPFGGGGLG
jgi:hypothetical protein